MALCGVSMTSRRSSCRAPETKSKASWQPMGVSMTSRRSSCRAPYGVESNEDAIKKAVSMTSRRSSCRAPKLLKLFEALDENGFNDLSSVIMSCAARDDHELGSCVGMRFNDLSSVIMSCASYRGV